MDLSEGYNRPTDIFLAVDRTLTDVERASFLRTFTRMNPHWQGAQVADVLAEMDNMDALLWLVEPAHEKHGNEVPEPGLLGACVRTVAFVFDTLPMTAEWWRVQGLVDRVRTAL